MAGSNPYRLSKVENERIFRQEILPGKLKNIGPTFLLSNAFKWSSTVVSGADAWIC